MIDDEQLACSLRRMLQGVAHSAYKVAGFNVEQRGASTQRQRDAHRDRVVYPSESGLERGEGLEQLRALEDGARIVVGIGNWPVVGVDTREDLLRAESLFRTQ